MAIPMIVLCRAASSSRTNRCVFTTLSAAHSLAGDGGVPDSEGPAGEKLRFMRVVLFSFDAAVSTRIDSVPPREHPIDSCTLALTPSRVLRHLYTCIARPLCIDCATS